MSASLQTLTQWLGPTQNLLLATTLWGFFSPLLGDYSYRKGVLFEHSKKLVNTQTHNFFFQCHSKRDMNSSPRKHHTQQSCKIN